MRISDWSSDVCSSDLHERRNCVRIFDHDLERRDTLGGAEIFLRFVERHEDEARIIFRHADLEDGDDRISLDPRRGDRRSVGEGKRGSVRVDPGGRRNIKKKNKRLKKNKRYSTVVE